MNATAIVETLGKNGISVEQAEVTSKVESFMKNFRVDEKTASTAVLNMYAKNAGIEIKKSSSKTRATVIELEKMKEGTWVDMTLKIIKIFDQKKNNIVQKGVAGDETGSVIFTIWSTANVPLIEEGQTIDFRNVVCNPYNGNPQISVNKSSELAVSDKAINYVPEKKEIVGIVTKVAPGSGLIKRCPVCEASLYKGTCKQHGTVEGIYDLRLILTIDDGRKESKIVAGRELTEKITGITLDTALAMAADALDHSTVREAQTNMFVGKYISTIVLDMKSTYLNACEITPMGE
jgi:replication factor A1